MNYKQTLKEMAKLHSESLFISRKFGKILKLTRIVEAAKKLDNPEKKLKLIHIAGSNGKGSVSAMVYSVLKESGYSVGLYTSPNLVDIRERIVLNDKKISKKDFTRIYCLIKKKKVKLSFFEMVTMIAFQYFFEKKVDYAVIEVGLGGSYDATNIIRPVATAITTISLEHTNILGNSFDKILLNKAGIIKQNIPLFTRINSKLLKKICEKKNAEYVIVSGKKKTDLKGEFQKKNAAIAFEICKHIGIKQKIIAKGLMKVYWPARLDFIEKNVLMDCAHNIDGVKNLSKFIKSYKHSKLFIIFTAMKDKKFNQMIKLLPKFDEIIFTKIHSDRCVDFSKIKMKKSIFIKDPISALSYVKKKASKNDLILVCGSCYLAGELFKKLGIEVWK